MTPFNPSLNEGQQKALEKLLEGGNIFLTGAAGTGKSFVVQRFLEERGDLRIALVATTGVASIIIGGRTFHSFFGLWNFHADYDGMIASALQMRSLYDRLKGTDCIVIDEVSMLNTRTIKAGEQIARIVRRSEEPWGGMQVVVTGDFCQLPPVTTKRDVMEGHCEPGERDWAFNSDVWDRSGFETIELTEIMRTSESRFLGVLAKLRQGKRDKEVQEFLAGRIIGALPAEEADMPMLFSMRDNVRAHNKMRLDKLPGAVTQYATMYEGEENYVKKMKAHCPLDETLELKPGALVMIRTNKLNDLPPHYANGTLAHYVGKEVNSALEPVVCVELKNGEQAEIPRKKFEFRNGDGKVVATASNFPLNLAWATTMHKSQGATMDELIVDMGRIWESGQAYVALSRIRSEEGLRILRPGQGRIFLDEKVKQFYNFPSLP